MAVYVYKFGGQGPKPFTAAYPTPWYGLTADTADELHPVAESLGLGRDMYRPVRSNGLEVPQVGHYELAPAEFDRAVANGATLITTREHKRTMSAQAAAIGLKKLD